MMCEVGGRRQGGGGTGWAEWGGNKGGEEGRSGQGRRWVPNPIPISIHPNITVAGLSRHTGLAGTYSGAESPLLNAVSDTLGVLHHHARTYCGLGS